MSASAVFTGIEAAFALVKEIIRMVKAGISDEEIRKRIAEPGGVAQDLIDAVKEREDDINDFIDNG